MRNIVLIGFSYTGKTAVGKAIAQRLGRPFLDTDDLIIHRAGMPIKAIFFQGEAYFRDLERKALHEACAQDDAVISTGGGSVIDPVNRALIGESGVAICLEARPETILRRLHEEQSTRGTSEAVRPLLEATDPLQRISTLKEHRQVFYSLADWTVHTDQLTVDEVATECVHGSEVVGQSRRRKAGSEYGAQRGESYEVSTSSGRYPGYVGWGIIPSLGWRMKEAGLSGTAHIIADKTVFDLYGQQVVASLNEAGFTTESFRLPPGESLKTLEHAGHLYQWLASRRAERGHCIVAIGGGVAGDLAGFVAATYLRGMPVVQVPTTLLAMVDASIGGKTAVNLPEGKNLVGAFHQPRLVLADVQTLTSLPARELRSGWAELVKHALILDRGLSVFLAENLESLRLLDPERSTEAITRSASIKARVVSADEKETSGFRALLNYGHTVGHALESVLAYAGLLHGEAVAIGMTAAADIASRMGMLPAGAVAEQRRMLEAFELPVKAPPVDLDKVRSAMALDKKVAGKRINWVLLEEVGRAVTRNDVPDEAVDAALAAIVSA